MKCPMKVATQTVDLKTEAGTCDAYVAHPETGGPFPGVILYMDAYGPRPYLFGMAKKLADAGYYVLLPNLLYRHKRAPIVSLPFPLTGDDLVKAREIVIPLARSYKPEECLEDSAVFLDFLDKQKEVRQGKFGVTGYCMGGGIAIRAAGQFPEKIAVAACFHGGNLATDDPMSPHRFLPKVKAELYIANADNDQSLPPAQQQKLLVALRDAKVRYEMELYQEAAHGFTMLDLPAGNEKALARHWEKLLPLFGRCLK